VPYITRLARDAGLITKRIECIEGRPEYLRLTAVTYLLGTFYEGMVNATYALEALRIVPIGILGKPGQ
jgi:hypothetical protein